MQLMELAEEDGLEMSAAATLMGVMEKRAAMMTMDLGTAKGLEKNTAAICPQSPATSHLVS